MDHAAFTLQNHHTRVSPRKHSPDGGTMANGSNHLIQSKSNQIRRFAKAPHHQSSGTPNIMTSNRDKKNKHKIAAYYSFIDNERMKG